MFFLAGSGSLAGHLMGFSVQSAFSLFAFLDWRSKHSVEVAKLLDWKSSEQPCTLVWCGW